MTTLFCVRAEFGSYTKHFVEGGFVAIGWMPDTDLSAVQSRDELYPLYKQAHPDDTSNIVVGQQVGQIAPAPSYLFDSARLRRGGGRWNPALHASARSQTSEQPMGMLAFSRATNLHSAARQTYPRPYFESRTLSALRDTLLPRLISGELRVRDADDPIQEASA